MKMLSLVHKEHAGPLRVLLAVRSSGDDAQVASIRRMKRFVRSHYSRALEFEVVGDDDTAEHLSSAASWRVMGGELDLVVVEDLTRLGRRDSSVAEFAELCRRSDVRLTSLKDEFDSDHDS